MATIADVFVTDNPPALKSLTNEEREKREEDLYNSTKIGMWLQKGYNAKIVFGVSMAISLVGIVLIVLFFVYDLSTWYIVVGPVLIAFSILVMEISHNYAQKETKTV